MKYEIKKGIEIPAILKKGKKKSELRLSIESMHIGDCIENISITRNHLDGILTSVKKNTGRKFSTRSVGDLGFSIWRIK